jgi:hypothetical protein
MSFTGGVNFTAASQSPGNPNKRLSEVPIKPGGVFNVMKINTKSIRATSFSDGNIEGLVIFKSRLQRDRLKCFKPGWRERNRNRTVKQKRKTAKSQEILAA